MKLLSLILFLALLIGCGIGGYVYLSQKSATRKSEYKILTLIGTVQKVLGTKEDYSHLLKTENKLIGLNTYTVKLDEYVGKTVAVTGQYSGTTFYVDTIVEKQ